MALKLAIGLSLSLLSSTAAHAQGLLESVAKTAKAELQAIPEEAQLTTSTRRCYESIDAKRREESRAWCPLASELAMDRVDMYGQPQPSPEIDLILRALWLDAVDGIWLQNNPWYGSPGIETIPIGADARRLSYVVLADLNRQNFKLMTFNGERLARLMGTERVKGESRGAHRERTLKHITDNRPKLRNEGLKIETFWATASIALTLVLTADETDDVRENARAVLKHLEGLAEQAENMEVQDAMLAPTLYLAQGTAFQMADDSASAKASFDRGSQLCLERLWDGAKLCDMLSAGMAPRQPRSK